MDQIALAKTEPGDENNQDISALVGKVDIRKLEDYAQNDPDAYSFSGALCKANQGLMEFVERFKAPIKVLRHLHRLWGFPVHLESTWRDETVATSSCPADVAASQASS